MGLLDLFKAAKPVTEAPIIRVMCVLKREDEPFFFIVIGSDGSVNRMGDATGTEREMVIGQIGPDRFEFVRQHALPVFKNWIGDYAGRDIVGTRFMLTVTLGLADGKEVSSRWMYGSESEGPPKEVGDVLKACAQATEAWYRSSKSASPSTPR